MVQKETNLNLTNTNSTPKSFRFGKQQRLLTKTDFSRVFDHAPVRAAHPCFLLLTRPTEAQKPRLGLIIAKKHVKRANNRNTIKRIVRESFRQRQHHLPAIDAIVLARKGADQLDSADIHSILNGLWKRIIHRYQKQCTEPSAQSL